MKQNNVTGGVSTFSLAKKATTTTSGGWRKLTTHTVDPRRNGAATNVSGLGELFPLVVVEEEEEDDDDDDDEDDDSFCCVSVLDTVSEALAKIPAKSCPFSFLFEGSATKLSTGFLFLAERRGIFFPDVPFQNEFLPSFSFFFFFFFFLFRSIFS